MAQKDKNEGEGRRKKKTIEKEQIGRAGRRAEGLQICAGGAAV